jgi:UDP-glucose 4-epimerase
LKAVVVGYGFIGKHIADALIANGDEVTVIEKRDVRLPKDAIRGDARYLERRLDADILFHFAGLTNYSYTEDNALECIESNISTTVNLLKRFDGRFVLASSAAVYAPSDVPLDEASPIAPHSIYGASKLASEHFVKAKTDDFAIARFFNVYGPGQSESFIIPQLIAQGKRGRISLRNSSTVRDYIFIDDAISALFSAAFAAGTNKMTVNIGTGIPTRSGELAEKVASMFDGCKVESAETFDSFSPRTLCADVSALKSLGWEPKVSLAEGLRKTAANP